MGTGLELGLLTSSPAEGCCCPAPHPVLVTSLDPAASSNSGVVCLSQFVPDRASRSSSRHVAQLPILLPCQHSSILSEGEHLSVSRRVPVCAGWCALALRVQELPFALASAPLRCVCRSSRLRWLVRPCVACAGAPVCAGWCALALWTLDFGLWTLCVQELAGSGRLLSLTSIYFFWVGLRGHVFSTQSNFQL